MTSPKSLLNLASMAATLQIWKEYLSTEPKTKLSNFSNTQSYTNEKEKHAKNMIENLLVADPIKTAMRKSLYAIIHHIRSWLNYHTKWGFFSNQSTINLEDYLSCFVWNPQSRDLILYSHTARDILKWGKVERKVKYWFICTYCWEDEIVKFGDVADCVSNINVKKDPLLYYWAKWANKELSKMNMKHVSINKYVLDRAFETMNYFAIAHFMKLVDSQTRVPYAIRIIEEYGVKLQNVALNSLNKEERIHVISEMALDVINNFMRNNHYWEAHKKWNESKGILNQEEKREMARRFFIYFEISESADDMPSLFKKIWATLDDENKRTFVLVDVPDRTFSINDFLHKINARYILDVIQVVIEDQEPHTRRHFFDENWQWIMLGQTPLQIHRFLQKIATVDEITSMRTSMKNSPLMERRCLYLLESGYTKEMDDFIWLCIEDSEEITKYTRSLLESTQGNEASQLNLKPKQWLHFLRYLKRFFTKHNEAADFQYQLILKSLENKGSLNNALKKHTTDYKWISCCINAYVTDAQRLHVVKEMAMSLIETNLKNLKDIDLGYSLVEFAKWCKHPSNHQTKKSSI